jgi:hypothetical protein
MSEIDTFFVKAKKKRDKAHLVTSHEGSEGVEVWLYSSALSGGEWS